VPCELHGDVFVLTGYLVARELTRSLGPKELQGPIGTNGAPLSCLSSCTAAIGDADGMSACFSP
jgi:hypothetical protein